MMKSESWYLIVIISILGYYFPNSIPSGYLKCFFFLTFIFCFRQLLENIKEKWYSLRGRSVMDCVRIYLNCARRWSLCGAKLFSVKVSVHILYYHKTFPSLWATIFKQLHCQVMCRVLQINIQRTTWAS